MMRGMTMIETLVYLALYAIVISGAVVSVYTIAYASERNRTEALVIEEGNFIGAKLSYLIAQADTVSVSPSGSTITIVSQGVVSNVYVHADTLVYQEGSRAPEPLTSARISVRSFSATRTPRGDVEIHFTLESTDAHGEHISREFGALSTI